MTATKRVVDFRDCVPWPMSEWWEPESFEETARQHAVMSRRMQGIPDHVTDATFINGVVALMAER